MTAKFWFKSVAECEAEQAALAGVVGKYFHTFEPTSPRVAKYQGRVDTDLGGGNYLCRMFGWLHGEATTEKIFSLSDFHAGHAAFYDDPDEWRERGAELSAFANELRRRQSAAAKALTARPSAFVEALALSGDDSERDD